MKNALEFAFSDYDVLLSPPDAAQRDSVVSVLEYLEGNHEETADLFTLEPGEVADSGVVKGLTEGKIFSRNDLKSLNVHAVCSSLVSFLKTVCPLVHYAVNKMCLNLPRTVNDYNTWVAHPSWDDEGKSFFFRVMEHFKWVCEKEETIYFRRTMRVFYEENGLDEKIRDIEMNLVKFKDREVQMFEKLGKKYDKPNPCDRVAMPAGLLAKSVGSIIIRRGEPPGSSEVTLPALIDTVGFILDADVLSRLKFNFTSSSEKSVKEKVSSSEERKTRVGANTPF